MPIQLNLSAMAMRYICPVKECGEILFQLHPMNEVEGMMALVMPIPAYLQNTEVIFRHIVEKHTMGLNYRQDGTKSEFVPDGEVTESNASVHFITLGDLLDVIPNGASGNSGGIRTLQDVIDRLHDLNHDTGIQAETGFIRRSDPNDPNT